MPLRMKNTSTAAPPCDSGCTIQAGTAANGAMCEIST